MEQIKIGDIVRVSEDVGTTYGVIPTKREFSVVTIGKYFSQIKLKGALMLMYYSVPTRYLIKVNAEPKEPKYRRGQKMVMSNGDIAIITDVNYNSEHPYSLLSLIDEGKKYWAWDEGELKPYAEPKEPTIKAGDWAVVKEDAVGIEPDKWTDKAVFEVRVSDLWIEQLIESGNVEAYAADIAKRLVAEYQEYKKNKDANNQTRPRAEERD